MFLFKKLALGFTVTQQETEPKLPASVEGPPVETWVGRGSPQGQEHWKVPLAVNLPGVPHLPYCGAHRPQGWVASGQTTTRERVQLSTHQKIIGLKLYWAGPCPPEQDPVFPIASPSHQEANTSLLASSIRGEADEARSTASQQLNQKPYPRKLIMIKKQQVKSQMKGQVQEKQLNEVEIGNLQKKNSE